MQIRNIQEEVVQLEEEYEPLDAMISDRWRLKFDPKPYDRAYTA